MDGVIEGRVAAYRRGIASNYISPFDIHYGNRIIFCIRVSGRAQRWAGNLADQREALRIALQRAGGVLVGIVAHTGPGTDPAWLAQAAAVARQRGARLLAESTDRFIRSAAYHSVDCPNAQTDHDELERLARVVGGCGLMTLIPPDARPSEVRSYQRQRGQERKGSCGGRGRLRQAARRPMFCTMKQRRKAWVRHILSMYRAGASYGEMSVGTDIPKMTCRNWVHEWLF